MDKTIRWRDSTSSQSTQFEFWASIAMDQGLPQMPSVSPPNQMVSCVLTFPHLFSVENHMYQEMKHDMTML